MTEPDRANPAAFRPLKLRARDLEDLAAIAACLQDALVPVSDMTYLKAEKRFVLVANRFRWEAQGAGDGLADAPEPEPEHDPETDARFAEADGDAPAGRRYERVNCGVCFDQVRNVQVRGLDMKQRDQILNLLTVEGRRGAVTLVFSGGAEVRLDVTNIRCHIEDLGEPWPTRWRPAHVDQAPAADAPG